MGGHVLRRLGTGALMLALPLAVGCGGKGVVTGKVTYEGREIKNGWISFVPAEGGGVTAGAPIKDGRFEIQGLAPGKKQVQITAAAEVDFPKHSPEPGEVRRAPAPAEPLVPPNAVGNGQTVDVRPGRQVLDFELRKPPG
jgi:hypothetical protein